MRGGPVLVVPATAKGRGGGHLVRSLVLLRDLRAAGREAWLFLPSRFLRPETRERLALSRLDGGVPDEWLIPEGEDIGARSWDWIILDYCKTPREELIRWGRLAPLIGIDEGGPFRDRFEFLLDLLPGPPGRAPPNLSAPAFLPLPKNRKAVPFNLRENTSLGDTPPKDALRVLVSFGAEDPQGLALPTVLALLPPPGVPQHGIDITLVQGGLSEGSGGDIFSRYPIRVRRDAPKLREELAGFDVLITHFGLTAFEALRAGTPVLLLSPTAYHQRLARHGGFLSAGIRRRGSRRLKKLIYRRAVPEGINYPALRTLAERCRGLAARYGLDAGETGSLGALLADAVPRLARTCPLCGAPPAAAVSPPALARFPGRTYRRCSRCGMVYMLRSGPPPIEYGAAYFFDSYKKQYGKTYLEDFPNLRRVGDGRLQRIGKFLPPGGGERLLDIGCAYGPFLSAAAEAGFSPLGVDPAEDPVRYVREELKLPAYQGLFPALSQEEFAAEETFSVITLWYVIEHFEDPGIALREIYRLLKPGGVLAFATPSISGVSGRKSPRNFLEKSPEDHWTVWDPRRVRGILARFGFRVKKIVVTGHHPERFPFNQALRLGNRGLARSFAGLTSRMFCLGDTFEVYAVKPAARRPNSIRQERGG